MKRIYVMAAATVILMTAACSKKEHSAPSSEPSTPAKPIPPPANGDWTQIVTATPQGGFMIGNLAAKVHLVEFGSLTCPHCKAFNDEGTPTLLADYVKPGKVSYEFRNYVRDPYDITAALIVRCEGAKRFFSLTDAMYKDQANWIGKVEALPPKQEDQLSALPENQQFLARAKLTGLQQWAANHEIPITKSTQCLTDEAGVDRLVQMNSDATDQYDIPGTPTFLINGKMVEKAATWDTLKPALDSALVQR